MLMSNLSLLASIHLILLSLNSLNCKTNYSFTDYEWTLLQFLRHGHMRNNKPCYQFSILNLESGVSVHLFKTESGLQRNHYYLLLTIVHLLYLEYVMTGDQYAH